MPSKFPHQIEYRCFYFTCCILTFNRAGQHLVTAENFRPNIVVSGCATPFQEDQWRKIQIVTSSEKIPMEVVKPCARCRVPNVRVATGEFDPDNTVNKTLKSFRTGEKAGFENQEWLKEVVCAV